MKKIVFILALAFILASCTKEKDTTNDLPKWLQERIAADEKEIAANPQSGKDLGAWLQYGYSEEVYFEYHNLLMSSLPKVYHYDSTELNPALPEYSVYQQGKCCKKLVWKGKLYIED